MKFGINTLLYTGTYTDEHVKDLSRKFAEMGFDGVEIALEKKGDIDYKKTVKIFNDHGLVCSSICGLFGENRDIRGPNKEYIEGGLSYIKDCLEACSELECKVLAGPVYSAVGRATLVPEKERKVQWDTVVENLGKACKWAEKYGVFIAIEPLNRFETDFINICKDAVKMVKDVGSKMLKIHLDAFHMNVEEKNSAMAVLDAGELLYLFHASENDRGAAGTGQVQWKAIADALRRINYDRWVVIESFTPENKVIAKAASIWRDTEKSNFILAEKGLKFLRGLFA
ncbi:MAG: D-tagatose 3-epimerase [Actinobacteria bacterium ADurb.Bin346]|nr:MAG: D-tagatose 3-epimerase [Actinobacteria bacterium ADurb.Bin346]